MSLFDYYLFTILSCFSFSFSFCIGVPAISMYMARCQIKIKEEWHVSEEQNEMITYKCMLNIDAKKLPDEMTHSDGSTLTKKDIRRRLTF